MSESDIWFTATGEEDGKPLIFRGRQNVPSGVVESDYATLLSIFWRYQGKSQNGMPDEETNNAQIELEDALVSLDLPGVSFLMLVVTGNGRKEWHWYVSDIGKWMARLNELLAGHAAFPIEIENSPEPDWALYHNFISGVAGI
jgi:Family of unknown function (DUF695)